MTKEDRLNRFLANTLQVEGGYVVDNGGPTNFGVTQKAYNDYRLRNKKPPASVKDITWGEAKDLYISDFYNKPRINKIKQDRLAGTIFDYAVNSGPEKAIKDLQELVGTDVDGIIGPKTMGAIDEYIKTNGEDVLLDQYINKRVEFMDHLIETNPQKYGPNANGWANRIKSIRQMYGPQENIPIE